MRQTHTNVPISKHNVKQQGVMVSDLSEKVKKIRGTCVKNNPRNRGDFARAVPFVMP